MIKQFLVTIPLKDAALSFKNKTLSTYHSITVFYSFFFGASLNRVVQKCWFSQASVTLIVDLVHIIEYHNTKSNHN